MVESIVSKIYEEYGIYGVVIIIMAVISLTFFIKYISGKCVYLLSDWKHKLKNGHKKSKELKLNYDLLKESIFFSSVRYKLRLDIPNLFFYPENLVVERIYRDILYMNIESFYYGCKRIIETKDFISISSSEWGSMIKREIAGMLKSYEYKAEDFGCPVRVIRHYHSWSREYIDLLHNHIDQLANSNTYKDNVLRTTVFLLIMSLLITAMIGDIRKLAAETADDIKGLEYRGEIL